MVELEPRARRRRLQGPQPGGLLFTEFALGPVRRLASERPEVGRVELADRREVVVADEHDGRPLAHDVGTLVRLGAVPNDVAEAPDLIGSLGVDVGQDRLEGVKIGMNV